MLLIVEGKREGRNELSEGQPREEELNIGGYGQYSFLASSSIWSVRGTF